MLGSNPLTKPDYESTTLRVFEIFETIQGEGPYAGLPATFIRFEGCNLRCYWCDTDFTGTDKTETGGLYTFSELVSKVIDGPELIVMTGGEPCIQNIVPLIRKLTSKSKEVQIETAGAVFPRGLEETLATVVISPKTARVDPRFKDCRKVWFKYVIGDDTMIAKHDGLPVESTQTPGKAVDIARPFSDMNDIFIQPQDGSDQVQSVQRACEIVMKYRYRLSLQQHKIVGLP